MKKDLIFLLSLCLSCLSVQWQYQFVQNLFFKGFTSIDFDKESVKDRKSLYQLGVFPLKFVKYSMSAFKMSNKIIEIQFLSVR